MRTANWIVATAFLLLAVGCEARTGRWYELPAPPPEIPVVNLPRAMRPHNWTDARGSGSCVIASSVFHFHWQNRPDLAEFFRKSYAGGQTADSIEKKWRAAGIPFASTYNPDPRLDHSGDPEFLDWASRSRRGAIIWFFDSHCVHFCGFARIGTEEFAILNDNNREANFIRIPKIEFLKRWRGYGGYACTALLSPAPSMPFRGFSQQGY